MLQECNGAVSIVGELRGDVVESCGVSVRLLDVQCECPGQGIVEVVGTLENSSAIKPVRITALNDFNIENYNKLVDLANGDYNQLF